MPARRKRGEKRAMSYGLWWAAISEDDPPQIWMVGPYRDSDHFQRNLRVIPVRVRDARLPPKPKGGKR